MKGTLSFHPVKLGFFDEIVQPLVAGRKVNPEPYLDEAVRFRNYLWRSRRYQKALQEMLDRGEPPRPEPGGGLLRNLRTRLERLDHREDELTRRIRSAIEPDLHLYGRPFFITEGSASRVAERVEEYRSAPHGDGVDSLTLEQLVHLDAEIARSLDPVEGQELSADLIYRSDLLAGLKDIYDIAGAARQSGTGVAATGARRPAMDVLLSELPWRAVSLHSRAFPFWVGRDVDGLETICRAAAVPPPDFIVPPRRLFAEACEEFPDLGGSLHVELQGPKDAAAFIAPVDVPRLLDFLGVNGSKIIRAATQHGEGATCTILLRKIKECASYAELHGMGYLEASEILPPDLEEESEEAA